MESDAEGVNLMNILSLMEGIAVLIVFVCIGAFLVTLWIGIVKAPLDPEEKKAWENFQEHHNTDELEAELESVLKGERHG